MKSQIVLKSSFEMPIPERKFSQPAFNNAKYKCGEFKGSDGGGGRRPGVLEQKEASLTFEFHGRLG